MPRKRHPKPPDTTEQFYRTLEKTVNKDQTVIHADIHGKKINRGRTVKIRHMAIAIGMPLDEVIFARFFTNFTDMRIMPWDYILTTTSTYLKEARNTIHEDYVRYCEECEYLFMLDSDVLPPPDIIDKLLAHKLPMVGGWYHKKGDPYPPCVYEYDNLDVNGIHNYRIIETPGKGLQKVDAAGAGCWLMRRDVAVAIGERPYQLDVGEDLELCRKVQQAGFDVYIDWDLACAHCGVAIV